MTDAATTPLQILGVPGAVVCEGDFCDVPAHTSHSIVNRRLDEDDV